MSLAVTTSVIICAYTEARWDELVAAVDSLGSQTLPPQQVIVVIDHNPTLLARATARFTQAIVVANIQSRGLTGARNTGIAVATSEIVAFLDDDAAAEPAWLARLVAAYERPTVAGVGGQIVPRWQHGRPAWFPTEFDWVVGCTYRGLPETVTPIRNLIGCNMSFRRQIFAQIGGFRIGRVGALSIGQENDDTELCIRLRASDPTLDLLYQPQAIVHHVVPASRGTLAYFVRRCYSEGLSKAALAAEVGRTAGLSSERTYTLRTLPLGVVVGIADTFRGRPSGLLRAGAIMLGLGVTTVGYAQGRLRLLKRRLVPGAALGVRN